MQYAIYKRIRALQVDKNLRQFFKIADESASRKEAAFGNAKKFYRSYGNNFEENIPFRY